LLTPSERALAVDHSFAVAPRRQKSRKRFALGECGAIAEELQLSGSVSGDELLYAQNAPSDDVGSCPAKIIHSFLQP
jgi:hypothetical protein